MSKKLLIAALVAVALILALYSCSFNAVEAQEAAPATEVGAQSVSTQPLGVFRDFIWGVSEEDVRRYETAIFHRKEGNSLLFLLPRDKKFIPSLKPMLKYDFKDGLLVSATYDYFELESPDPQRILDLFSKHQYDLTQQFGKPAKEEFSWKNERYKKYPQFWARALYARDLWFKTTWVQGDTEVILQTYNQPDGQGYKLFYTASKIVPKTNAPTDILQLDTIPEIRP